MKRDLADGDQMAVVSALVQLSSADLYCADQYLRRAEMLLPALCTRDQYLALRRVQEQLPRVKAELRQAVERGDWAQVHTLARHAGEAHEQLGANEQVLRLADAIYGPRLLHADGTALGLAGVVAQPAASLRRARDATVNQLRFVLSRDLEWGQFYSGRVSQFERLQIVPEEHGGLAPRQRGELERRLGVAMEKDDFAEIQRLADSMAAENADRLSRLHAAASAPAAVPEEGPLAAPFPEAAVLRARNLGLTAEILPLERGLESYMSCACASQPTFPSALLTESDRVTDSSTCGHPCPPGMRETLRDALDLLLLHPFVSSALARYLPWFGLEAILVETYPEAEPDADTALLRALGLRRRRGVARLQIEDAIRTHGSNVCIDLGLDPSECVVACIPFDAYLRLAPRYGWGQRLMWTHFDGYQVTHEVHLRALVGGDVRYGGPDDLCSVERDYDADRLTVRFAIVRRERFAMRGSLAGTLGGGMVTASS